jgi:hypothetical protein
VDGSIPPKPKGMHWRTYEAALDRCQAYLNKSNFYWAGFIGKLGHKNLATDFDCGHVQLFTRGALGRSVVAPRVAIEARQPVFRADVAAGSDFASLRRAL